jgi:subtilisin family serine protease
MLDSLLALDYTTLMVFSHKGFSTSTGILAVILIAGILLAGWNVYRINRETKAVASDQSQVNETLVTTLGDTPKTFRTAGLDLQFAYPAEQGEPVRRDSDGTRSKAGLYYSYSLPGYDDRAWIIVGTPDYDNVDKDDDASAYANAMFGDVTVSLDKIRQSITAQEAARLKADTITGYPLLVSFAPDKITYALSDDGSTTHLVTVKHMPSSKRAANVVFTMSIDTSRSYDGTEKADATITDLVNPRDLGYFNAVADSIKPYR